MNWQTGIPKINPTSGKSKLLLCKVQWENEIYPALAFYNGRIWIENNKLPVVGTVTGWQEFYL